METVNEDGEYVRIDTFATSIMEDRWVAEEIHRLNEMGYKYGDMAILYRTNATSRNFEQSLRMAHIPCKVIGGRSFFDYVVVKTCINYLDFYSNPNNLLAFNKIINKPRRSIATEMVSRIEKYCISNKISIIDALRNIDEIQIESIGDKRKEELKKFQSALEKKPEDISLVKTAERIFTESGLINYIEELTASTQSGDMAQGKSSAMDIYNSFMDMLKEWETSEGCTIEKLLEYISLQSDNDDVDNSDKVKLMTLHTSKGLEFPIVFIVCAEEGHVPHKFSLDTGDPEDIEEERRLFYVGMTRAKKILTITNSNKRILYSGMEQRFPSRFIREIKLSGSTISRMHNYL